jgi:hypothetical protein
VIQQLSPSTVKRMRKAELEYQQSKTVIAAPNIIVTRSPKEKAIAFAEFALKGRIRSGSKMLPFALFPFQVALIEQIEAHYTTVITKTRQTGLTELIATYFIWKASIDPSYLSVTFSKGQEDTRNIAKRCRLFISTHSELELVANSLQDLTLKNGGRLLFKPSTDNAGRSLESVHDLLFDECSFVDNVEQISGAASGANEMVGDRAKVIYCSTPNGKSGYHFDLLNNNNGDRIFLNEVEKLRRQEATTTGIKGFSHWTDSEAVLKAIVHYTAHPIYGDRTDYLKEIQRKKQITESTLQREYNLGYADSTANIFDLDLVKRGARGAFAPPDRTHRYLMGVDSAYGGGDYFAVHVWDITSRPYSLVKEYRAQGKTKDFNVAQVLYLIEDYRKLKVSVESNAGGTWCAQDVAKRSTRTEVIEVNTNSSSKLVNTDRLVIMLERDELIYPADSWFAKELPNFRQNSKGQRKAATGHDDTVMAAAIAFADFDDGRQLTDMRKLF